MSFFMPLASISPDRNQNNNLPQADNTLLKIIDICQSVSSKDIEEYFIKWQDYQSFRDERGDYIHINGQFCRSKIVEGIDIANQQFASLPEKIKNGLTSKLNEDLQSVVRILAEREAIEMPLSLSQHELDEYKKNTPPTPMYQQLNDVFNIRTAVDFLNERI